MSWVHPPALGCRFSFLHLPCGRCGHSICLYNDSLVLFGGFDGKKWLNDLHFFCISSLVWSQPRVLGAAPSPRQHHSSCIVRAKMYVFGGYNGSNWLSDLVVLDLKLQAALSLTATGDAPSPREGHSMAAYNEDLYVFGGWDGAALGELYKLDTRRMEWSSLKTAGESPQLCGHSMNLLGSQIIVFGGFDGLSWGNRLFIVDLDSEEPLWRLPEVKGVPVSRGYHSATLVDRCILVYGGYNGQFILGDLLALDTETFTWVVPDDCPGHLPAARNAHSVTLCGSELFLFGGYNGTQDTNELHVLETAVFSSLHDDLYKGYHESA